MENAPNNICKDMWTNIYRANRPIQIRNYISRKMHTHGFEEFERKFDRNKRKI